jgi:tetratricopeptide (TPR) repeat protein
VNSLKEGALSQPALVGREAELERLRGILNAAAQGKGSAVFVAGEAGVGKTRLISELVEEAEARGVRVIRGRGLQESYEPLMPIRIALREAGLFHLISGETPPLVVSVYLMDRAGLLVAKAERGESELDPYIFASMLKAVGSFVKDSMKMVDKAESSGGLNILGYNEYKILVEETGGLNLAAVVKGSFNEFLIGDMRGVLSDVRKGFDGVLKEWDGDVAEVEGVQPLISRLITSGKYDGRFLVDDSKIMQENLFDNVLMGLQRLSAGRPILVFLDDLQWVDPSSLALVNYLARNVRGDKVAIVGAYRPEDLLQSQDGKTHQLEILMQNMGRDDLLERIELRRLDRAGTDALVTGALGASSFEPAFFERIYQETEGTPFFVLEVVRLLAEEGCLKRDGEGAWRLTTGIDRLDIPSKVYDVIKRRLDRLAKGQYGMLECASVVGEEFQSEVVGRAMGADRMELLRSLSEIEKAHRLIHSIKKGYRFDHAKIREVLYSGIIAELRREYHRAVGDAIAALHEGDQGEVVGELAYHYHQAGDARAGGWLVRAGDKARERYASVEAERLYESALETIEGEEAVKVLESLGDITVLIGDNKKAIARYEEAGKVAKDPEVRARNLRKAGDAHENMGEHQRSLDALARAKALLEGLKVAELGRISLGEGRAHFRKGDYDRAMPLLLEAVQIFEEFGGAERDVGNALRAIGNVHWSKGEYDVALENLERSQAAMEKADDKQGIAAALNNIGIVHHYRGEMDRALEFDMRSLAIQEKIGNKQGIALVLGNIGNVHLSRGELDRALEFYERSLKMEERIGDKRAIAMSLNNIGTLHHTRGEMDMALGFYERSLGIFDRIGDKSGTALSLNNVGIVHLERGELDIALGFYERSLEIKEKLGDRKGIAGSLEGIGNVHLARGEARKALELQGRNLEICKGIGDRRLMIRAYCGLAEANLGLGDVKTAVEQARKAVGMAVEIGARSEEGRGLLVLGVAHREARERDEAVREFEKASAVLEGVGDRKELARLLYERGLLLKDQCDIFGAKEHISQALSAFEQMGMMLWADRCRKMAGELEISKGRTRQH